MLIKNRYRCLTLYDFDGPPSTILDLGCGRGLLAIEAAEQWQVSGSEDIVLLFLKIRECRVAQLLGSTPSLCNHVLN